MIQFHSLPDLILPLRQQAEVRNRWLSERFESILPDLMTRSGFDMWLVIAREYNEDPVIMSLLPEPNMSARRRTILAFCRNEDGSVDRFTVSRYGQPGFYDGIWNPAESTQHERLKALIEARQPKRIGINTSANFAFADGLSAHEKERLEEALGPAWMAKCGSAEALCLGWLETRLPSEWIAYRQIVAIGHAIIAQAFSNNVIHPGMTSTDDVVWWMRHTMKRLELDAWFQPTIAIQAKGVSFEDPAERQVILPGDLLHCDMGFTYLGLATDQQQHAYVMKPGEASAPEGLAKGLAAGNRLQVIHMGQMKVGRTGNEVLKATLDQAAAEGIDAQIYSHPLGYHGHAAGPTIGLWDQQGGVPGKGDYRLYDSTAYSIELNAKVAVPEWDNQLVRFALEEDAMLNGGRMRWLDGRQTELHLIK